VLDPEDEPKLWEALAVPPAFALPLARLALLTGMRENELLTLEKTEAISGAASSSSSIRSGGGTRAEPGGLPVCEEALKLLAELCARTGGRLFTDDDVGPVTLSRSSNLFRRRAAAVGLAGMGFHFLRRTFGTRLGEAGVGPYAIARLMGHSNIKTSMIYVHPPVESLRRAAEAAASRRAGHPADT